MLGHHSLTLCRNLQSTGRVSLPSFCTTMWVRLSRDTFSLQLHTALPWIREFGGTEDKKRRGSPNNSFMIGLAEMRESARMIAFTSLSCRSKCCRRQDDKRKTCSLQISFARQSYFLKRCNLAVFLPSAEE